MPRLLIKFQDAIIKEVDIDKASMTIGRKEDNDVCIDHMAVSGHHAKIESKEGRFVLSDLKSTNGTYVNGKRITETILRPNDWISIGMHILYFK